jgi:predicted nuclease of predicted toxin-antitoxin system
MKLLIDAQLPKRLAECLEKGGHDCVHTLDLPHGNHTTDHAIIQIADTEERIVVT